MKKHKNVEHFYLQLCEAYRTYRISAPQVLFDNVFFKLTEYTSPETIQTLVKHIKSNYKVLKVYEYPDYTIQVLFTRDDADRLRNLFGQKHVYPEKE